MLVSEADRRTHDPNGPQYRAQRQNFRSGPWRAYTEDLRVHRTDHAQTQVTETTQRESHGHSAQTHSIKLSSTIVLLYRTLQYNMSTRLHGLRVTTLDDAVPFKLSILPRIEFNQCPFGCRDCLHAGEGHVQLPQTPDSTTTRHAQMESARIRP